MGSRSCDLVGETAKPALPQVLLGTAPVVTGAQRTLSSLEDDSKLETWRPPTSDPDEGRGGGRASQEEGEAACTQDGGALLKGGKNPGWSWVVPPSGFVPRARRSQGRALCSWQSRGIRFSFPESHVGGS